MLFLIKPIYVVNTRCWLCFPHSFDSSNVSRSSFGDHETLENWLFAFGLILGLFLSFYSVGWLVVLAICQIAIQFVPNRLLVREWVNVCEIWLALSHSDTLGRWILPFLGLPLYALTYARTHTHIELCRIFSFPLSVFPPPSLLHVRFSFIHSIFACFLSTR